MKPRPLISNEKTIKQMNRLKSMFGYESDASIIEAAVALLWEQEKNQALVITAQKQTAYYKKHSEELEFEAVISGVV